MVRGLRAEVTGSKARVTGLRNGAIGGKVTMIGSITGVIVAQARGTRWRARTTGLQAGRVHGVLGTGEKGKNGRMHRIPRRQRRYGGVG
ncbi:hypothetical protein ElyMa_004775000 [Elysia marginata]|uniref:Uncharacterized protein n=1 Tax=Elysia marginata TaxID=1093978 RepID=A0AAV4IIT6_9GAST|nr:hypothetical protein ElyMa_004775000 [Elysia marginata]